MTKDSVPGRERKNKVLCTARSTTTYYSLVHHHTNQKQYQLTIMPFP